MGEAAYTSITTGTTTTTGDYAARLCDNHEAGGYSDWFLPSIFELDLMYENLKSEGQGGFFGGNYWSSSEGYGYSAWSQSFYSGSQNDSGRGNEFRVRPVRAF
jgi:hypothetical protein